MQSETRAVIRRIQAAVRAIETPEGSEAWREEVKAAIDAVERDWEQRTGWLDGQAPPPVRVDPDEKPYVAPAGFLGDIREKHHGDDDGHEN